MQLTHEHNHQNSEKNLEVNSGHAQNAGKESRFEEGMPSDGLKQICDHVTNRRKLQNLNIDKTKKNTSAKQKLIFFLRKGSFNIIKSIRVHADFPIVNFLTFPDSLKAHLLTF